MTADVWDALLAIAAAGFAGALIDGDIELAARFAVVASMISEASPPPLDKHVRAFAERLAEGNEAGARRSAMIAWALGEGEDE